MLEPAKAVGGDFYTFFERGDGRLWFAIGDVSDKGVPAALFMARAMTVLEVAARARRLAGPGAGRGRRGAWSRATTPACSPPCCAAC